MIFVDSHCHVDAEQFDADRDAVLNRAREAGVGMMLVIGTGDAAKLENFTRVVDLANENEGIYAAIGVHPHDAVSFDETAERRFTELARINKKIIGWGEIGLDFYYDHSPREIQEAVFRRQIHIARELDLPIIIHSRDADEQTVKILTEECSHSGFRGGVMHCFGGTAQMAERLMRIGFMISFAGNITFKKAENLREAARIVPLDRLLIETDCPYLAPIPMRGKRNEPAFVRHTAQYLADFYELSLKELANQTTRNFMEFFKIDSAARLANFQNSL